MALLADTAGAVIGVDTHAGTHTACLADRLGRQLAVITIAADPGGCRRLLAWARRHAPGPRLRQPFCRQGITGGPGRVVSRVGLAAHLAIQVPPRPAEA